MGREINSGWNGRQVVSKRDIALDTAVEDVCLFHRYLDRIYDVPFFGPHPIKQELYVKMESLAEKYSGNNSLKNKLDEAEKLVWPFGRNQL